LAIHPADDNAKHARRGTCGHRPQEEAPANNNVIVREAKWH